MIENFNTMVYLSEFHGNNDLKLSSVLAKPKLRITNKKNNYFLLIFNYYVTLELKFRIKCLFRELHHDITLLGDGKDVELI